MFIAFAIVVLLGSCANGDGRVEDIVEDNSLLVADPLILKGLDWLWRQRDLSFGFKDNTAKSVAVLQLANASGWYSNENLHSLISVKQMEIELLIRLSRHHDTPPVPTEMAEYSLALSSLCRDPRQFHGFDVIGILTHHELLLDWEFAISSLAVCASGAHVRKRQLRRLLDSTESHDNLSIETLSMVMIALNCIVHDHRNRNLQHYLIGPTKFLGKMQKTDGSFGNLKTTAMAVQALQATDPIFLHWNGSAAIAFLKNQQQEDGSFGEEKDIEATITSLLALGPRSLANIKDLNCHTVSNDDFSSVHLADLTLTFNLTMNDHQTITPNKTVTEASVTNITTEKPASLLKSNSIDDGKVTVFYTLWVATNASSVRTLNITTDRASNFYYVMQLAAQNNTDFAFQATEWPNGHYIHTLAGRKEEPMTYHYWLLYKLQSPPNIKSPPTNQFVAPLGVDDLIVKDKDIYLFWYKKL